MAKLMAIKAFSVFPLTSAQQTSDVTDYSEEPAQVLSERTGGKTFLCVNSEFRPQRQKLVIKKTPFVRLK